MNITDSDISISDDYVITTKPIAIEPTKSVGSFLFENMLKFKDEIAQIESTTDKRDTFGDLLQRSIRTALHMADKNITRNDIITICSKNHIDVAVPYIATQFLGAINGSVDPSFTLSEMNHLLSIVRPKMIFTKTESLSLIKKCLKEISLDSEVVVFDYSGTCTAFADFLKPHTKEKIFTPVHVEDLKDTAAIYFSSGTTGLPKGVCLSHYSLIGQIINARVQTNSNENFKEIAKKISFPITCMCYTSFYWLSAGVVLLLSVHYGICRLICEDFDEKEIWNHIEKYKPSLITVTPVQAIKMLENKKSVDLTPVLSVSIVGSKLPKQCLVDIIKTFPDAAIPIAYGQTEVSGAVTMVEFSNKLHTSYMNDPAKIETVGVPIRGVLLKVVDTESGENLGPNQQGELYIKSSFLMNGYYKMDSSETFEDGWLKTGDVLYYDKDLYFYYVDRLKEAFKYQGWFVAPADLENVLLQHPAVKMSVVVGIPKDDGYHLMGLVVLNSGYQVTEKEIEKFVEERVSERQRLRAGVKFIKEVPLTATGKIKRRELKQMVLEGKI